MKKDHLSIATSAGTGNHLCRTDPKAMLYLNNEPINPEQIKRFMSLHGIKGLKVTLSNRPTHRRWGTAWPGQGRCVLYRHSVWVFLHELAHLLTPELRRSEAHGPRFAQVLDDLAKVWLRLFDSSLREEPRP